MTRVPPSQERLCQTCLIFVWPPLSQVCPANWRDGAEPCGVVASFRRQEGKWQLGGYHTCSLSGAPPQEAWEPVRRGGGAGVCGTMYRYSAAVTFAMSQWQGNGSIFAAAAAAGSLSREDWACCSAPCLLPKLRPESCWQGTSGTQHTCHLSPGPRLHRLLSCRLSRAWRQCDASTPTRVAKQLNRGRATAERPSGSQASAPLPAHHCPPAPDAPLPGGTACADVPCFPALAPYSLWYW